MNHGCRDDGSSSLSRIHFVATYTPKNDVGHPGIWQGWSTKYVAPGAQVNLNSLRQKPGRYRAAASPSRQWPTTFSSAEHPFNWDPQISKYQPPVLITIIDV